MGRIRNNTTHKLHLLKKIFKCSRHLYTAIVPRRVSPSTPTAFDIGLLHLLQKYFTRTSFMLRWTVEARQQFSGGEGKLKISAGSFTFAHREHYAYIDLHFLSRRRRVSRVLRRRQSLSFLHFYRHQYCCCCVLLPEVPLFDLQLKTRWCNGSLDIKWKVGGNKGGRLVGGMVCGRGRGPILNSRGSSLQGMNLTKEYWDLQGQETKF